MLLARIPWAHTNVLAKLDTLEMATNALVSSEICYKCLPYFALLHRKLTHLVVLRVDFIYRLNKYALYNCVCTELLLFSLSFVVETF